MSPPPSFSSVCVELLRAGTVVRFTATGSSMAPTIREGDVITVSPVRADEVAAGDVVLYASRRGLTAHRVMGKLEGPEPVLRARGDAPGSAEELVCGGQLLGRVRQVERLVRATEVGPRPLPVRVALGLRIRAGLRRLAVCALRRRAAPGPHVDMLSGNQS